MRPRILLAAVSAFVRRRSWTRTRATLLCIALGFGAMACQPDQPNFAYVASVAVTPDSAVTYLGARVQVTATPLAPGGIPLDDRVVTWISSDRRIATVSRTGEVTTLGIGTVSITALCETETGVAEIRILPRPIADWSHVTDEWTTHQGNPSHTGRVPATVDPLVFSERWDVDVMHGRGLNAVIEGEGHLFATSTAYYASEELTALDAATGAGQWSFDLGQQQAVGPPAYGDHAVYVGSSGTTSSLWAFEANSGVQRFQAHGTDWGVAYAPVPDGAAIYTSAAYDGSLFSFNAPDGAMRWTNQFAYDNSAVPAVREGRAYVYSTSNEAKVTVSDAVTGALLYEIPDPGFLLGGWAGRSVPVLGEGDNLVVAQSNRLASFDLTTHAMAWEVTGVAFRDDPSVANGVVYAHTPSSVEARRESDGTLLWSWTVPPAEALDGPMVVTNNVLFVSGSATTFGIDLLARAVVWRYPAFGRLALTRDGLLLIARANGRLTAIELK